ncbi:tripartite motif-containing protein 29-like [Engraulis encrasicolus]|uniref:tripartite motif-containing protein 29-like n=1 Tax=Engraulis encrasicolus TaxID=184585 RepID=UPI002FCF6336
MKKSRTETAAAVECAAGPGDIGLACDVCTERKLKAVKSCLECLLSYCDTHLKAHDELIPGRNHTIIATVQLQEMICPRHKKILEIFCHTDQSYICYRCTMGNHAGHDTEWSHKKEELVRCLRLCQQIIQLKEKELQELRKDVETLKSAAETAVEESERMFIEMISSALRRRSEVTKLIRAQEKAEVRRAEGLLKQLEQKIAELKRTDAEMKQLSQTQGPFHLLKSVEIMSSIVSDTSSDVTRRTFSQRHLFEPLKESVSALKMQLEETLDSFLEQEIVKISAADTDPELPVRRADSKNLLPPDNTDRELPVRRTDSKERLPPNRDAAPMMGMKTMFRSQSDHHQCNLIIGKLDPNERGCDITDQVMSAPHYSHTSTGEMHFDNETKI